MIPFRFLHIHEFAEQCLSDISREIRFTELRSRYEAWMDAQWSHRSPIARPESASDRTLSHGLESYGFTKRKTGGVMVYAPPVAPTDTTD